ncbi:MAG TPA: ABC transporter permease subunit/CPBP intramembrane protease [Longimicrobiales bacterium]|nr:ABC transporter permease subunit/CPBP intramembrane protease [Longimicrobiales bacterium]
MRIVWVVVKKEFREILRDWRTLTMMLLVPALFYPGMFVAIEQLFLMGRRHLTADPVRIAVAGEAPELVRLLDARPDVQAFSAHHDPSRIVLRGRVDAGAAVEAAGPDGARPRVTIYYDQASDRSRAARDALNDALREWRDTLVARSLAAHGAPPELAAPIETTETSVTPSSQRGLLLVARLLPFLLIMVTILGTFYPAIDLGAGEKERRTLEALMTAPVPASRIVAGKFVTVTLIGIVAALLNLLSMMLTMRAGLFQATKMLGLDLNIPWSAMGLVLLTLVPLAILFGATFLGISVQAHSFKEAQSALTPVFLVGALPALLPAVPGIELTPTLAVVPVAGVSLLFRDLMAGQVDLGYVVIVVLANLGYALAAIHLSARAFGREEVLFGAPEPDVDDAPGLEGLLRRIKGPRLHVPTPRAAVLFTAVAAAVYFYAGRIVIGVVGGPAGILAAEWLLMFTPALAFLYLGGFSYRRTLLLRRPNRRQLLAALLAGAGSIPMAWVLARVGMRFLPLPVELSRAAEQLFARPGHVGDVALLFAVVVITPAVCEEVIFRGILFTSLRRTLSLGTAALVTAVVFGAFHVSSESALRFMPTAWTGLVVALVAGRTGSIWTGMIVHALNNGVLLALALSPGFVATLEATGLVTPTLVVPLALACLAGAIWLLASDPGSARLTIPEGPEPEPAPETIRPGRAA